MSLSSAAVQFIGLLYLAVMVGNIVALAYAINRMAKGGVP